SAAGADLRGAPRGGGQPARARRRPRSRRARARDGQDQQVGGVPRAQGQRLSVGRRERGDRLPARAVPEVIAPLELPDEPRWIEAHGIAADPASWRRELGGGFAVGNDRARLIVIAGDADAAQLATLAREQAQHTLLVASERRDLAAATGRSIERALLHTLPPG